MYQDKIEVETKEALSIGKPQQKHRNIFAKSALIPLDFIPDEDICDATHIARDILSKRSNEDVILLSKAIDYMLLIGDKLLESLSMQLLKGSTTRKSITLTQGRSLYLLYDYFDLSTLETKKVQWSELFAVLTLMQSAEIVHLSSQRYEQDEFFKEALLQSAKHCINELKEESIDSIARAECLYDKKMSSYSTAKSGGEAKAKNMEPLKAEVINRYLKHFTHLNKKRAGREVDKMLTNEKHPLLLLSYSEDKDLQFAKWIGLFLDKNLKLSVNI